MVYNRNFEKIESRYLQLQKEVKRLRDLYHIQDISEISDEALDSLKKEIVDLEKAYPAIKKKRSEADRVSGDIKKEFSKIRHKIRQWSLADAFEYSEIEEFDKRLKKLLGRTDNLEYFIEQKIDGAKLILEYSGGNLKSAATRGDGFVGENITENIIYIKDIPKTINTEANIVIEGELYMKKKEFNRINRMRSKDGLATYQNPRNLVSGSIRQLNISVLKSREILSFFYKITFLNKNRQVKTQEDQLNFLKKLGFSVNDGIMVKYLTDVKKYRDRLSKQREKLPYLIDGIVLKLNNLKLQKQLGYSGKSPRYAIAYKFDAEQKTTVIEDITFQVGRTGVITPVAELTSIFVAGTNVSRATLHNEDFIKTLGIRIGDTVIIKKAGDIIPEIVGVIKNLRSKTAKAFVWPKKIKECGGNQSIIRQKGKSAYVCVNKNSSYLLKSKLTYFVSKQAFNIDGLSVKTIEKLIDKLYVKTFDDLFKLTKEHLLEIDGFKEKSASNLIKEIEKAKNISLSKFITALSIDGVGVETADLLAIHFLNLDKLKSAKYETLLALAGLGDIVASNIHNWFKENKQELSRLIKCISIKNYIPEIIEDNELNGKKIVITGTFNTMNRNAIKERLKQKGTILLSTLSSNTDYLIVGESPGSKFKKAKELGIHILDKQNDLLKDIIN